MASAKRNLSRVFIRLVSTALIALSSAGAFASGPLEEANKKLVLEFHAVVLNGKNADAAPKYVAENYIQHNPRVPNGLAGLQGFVRELSRNSQDARVTIKRVIAEGDLVVLHSHMQRSSQERGSVLVDIFRVENGKLAEHWDVLQPIPESSVSGNGML